MTDLYHTDSSNNNLTNQDPIYPSKCIKPGGRLKGENFIQISKDIKIENYDTILKLLPTDPIGEGSFGRVFKSTYKITDDALETNEIPVAIKECTYRSELDQSYFKYEMNTLGFMRHTNIIKLLAYAHKVYENNNLQKIGVYLMVMEFGGITLEKYVSKGYLVKASQAVEIAIQLNSGLDYLHDKCSIDPKKRVIHRDIKIDNVMILQIGKNETVQDPTDMFAGEVFDKISNPCQTIKVKIIDLGLARDFLASFYKDHKTSTARKAQGNAAYLSPEILKFKNKDIDPVNYTPAMDIYASGLMFGYIVTGLKPYENDPISKIRDRNLPILPKQVPGKIRQLHADMIRFAPSKRITAWEAMLSFEDILRDEILMMNFEQAWQYKADWPENYDYQSDDLWEKEANFGQNLIKTNCLPRVKNSREQSSQSIINLYQQSIDLRSKSEKSHRPIGRTTKARSKSLVNLNNIKTELNMGKFDKRSGSFIRRSFRLRKSAHCEHPWNQVKFTDEAKNYVGSHIRVKTNDDNVSYQMGYEKVMHDMQPVNFLKLNSTFKNCVHCKRLGIHDIVSCKNCKIVLHRGKCGEAFYNIPKNRICTGPGVKDKDGKSKNLFKQPNSPTGYGNTYEQKRTPTQPSPLSSPMVLQPSIPSLNEIVEKQGTGNIDEQNRHISQAGQNAQQLT